jgi:hypothetical protein
MTRRRTPTGVQDTLALHLEVTTVAVVTPLHQPQPRWEPDEMLIEAAIAGRVRHDQLTAHDRAWLIAHLTHRGVHTETIAAWLHCSRRTVQTARGEPVAVLTTRLLVAQAASERAESRAAASRITPAALTATFAELDHLRQARGRLIDQLAEMRRRCAEPIPDQIIIVKPAPTRRRRGRQPDCTLPLFEVTA